MSMRARVCAYGTVPGTWVSAAPTGAKWHSLDARCPLRNLIAQYAGVRSGGTHGTPHPLPPPPPLSVLLLSDSVSTHVLRHVCHFMGGEARMMRSPQLDALAEEQGENSGHRYHLKLAYALHVCEVRSGAPPLQLAAAYFPGVSPQGPFHLQAAQNYAQRFAFVAHAWRRFARDGQPPQVVSVASAMWDMAKVWHTQYLRVKGRDELPPNYLAEWTANFSAVVRHAQGVWPQVRGWSAVGVSGAVGCQTVRCLAVCLPLLTRSAAAGALACCRARCLRRTKTRLWVTHTTMTPRHDPDSGAMAMIFLGRRYFFEQLNAATAAVAPSLGLQLLDYAALSRRFLEHQSYLLDDNHPNAEVSLEAFNVLLNLAAQAHTAGSTTATPPAS
jgi:hypothetical protein